MSLKTKTSVLIVGAGPSGLAMALWLKMNGVSFRIVDKNPAPIKNSGAVIIHGRTLEFYQQLEIADEIIAAGRIISDIKFSFNNRSTVPLGLAGQASTSSAFTGLLILPQDIHEKILIEKLKTLNVEIERNLELKKFTQGKYQVESVIRGQQGEENIFSSYLCGCDGADSLIRRILGVKFFKKSFRQDFFIADVVSPGADCENSININLSRQSASITLPLQKKDSARVMGIIPKESENKENLSFINISDQVTKTTQLKIDEVSWFSVYKVDHRVASHIRQGRTFLVGGAAHIHSPVFSQGMNAGIGDAINLSWKLAAVLKGQAASKILLTFETERLSFAEKLRAGPDRFFYFILGRNFLSSVVRSFFLPFFITLFKNFSSFSSHLYKLFSQAELRYSDSLLSEGSTGKIRGGDRLPWLKTASFDNYNCLKLMAWHIQIYGKTHSNFNSVANFRGFRIYQFEWSQGAEAKGFIKDAFYLVRPDGYIALCDLRQNISVLKKYLNEWDIDHNQNLKADRSTEKFQLDNQI